MSETLTMTPAQMGRMTRSTQPATVAISAPLVSALAGAFVALVAFVAYAMTVAPDLYSLDSPELATAAYRLGIAHPPGYPLYTLSGWLFSHAFPVSNVAFRLNLLSSLFAVAAVTTTYALALRLTSRPLVAAAGALALAFSYYFWADALTAEIYTLDAALFAGLLLAAVAWRSSPTPARAAVVGLLFGLGCATRTTTALYAPALVAFAWMSGERSPRSYAAAAGALAAGLLFYAYLPLRSASGASVGPGDYSTDGALHIWDLASIGGFWRHISASAFRSDVFAYGPVDALKQSGIFAGQLAGSFLVVGVPLGLAGIVRQWRSDRAALVLLAGAAAPVTLFFINYGAIDKEFMFLPAYVVWSLWMVLGIDWAVDVMAPDGGRAALIAGTCALALPAIAFAVNMPLVSLHSEHRVRDDSERFLGKVADGAIVYGAFTDVAPYQYLQQVEGVRTDVKLVNAWTVDDAFLLQLAAANVGKSPFYITRDERSLHGLYQLVPVEKGFEVKPRPGS